MARRKRKDDEPEWTPPEFDEVTYMRTEIAAARVAVITILWALVGGLVSYALSGIAALAFVAGIGVAFGLYFVLPLIGIDIKPFKRKDWMAHGITYFFSWLAFWILLLNPPFGDFTDPTIQGISVSPTRTSYTGPWFCRPVDAPSITLPMNGNTTILVLFRATDNVGLANVNVTVAPTPLSGSLTPTPVEGTPSRCPGQATYPGGTYQVSFVPSGSAHTVSIAVADRSGRGAGASFQVQPT